MTQSIATGVLLAALATSTAFAGQPLPIAKRVFAEKTTRTEISIAYPQTGMKAIDDDIRALVIKQAKQFRKTAEDVYQKGDGIYTEDADYKIVRNDAKGLALMWQSTEDFHGAHPSHEYIAANYLLPDGWRVYLPEIVDGARGLERISALARSQLNGKLLSGPEPLSDKDWIARGTTPEAHNFDAFLLLPGAIRIQFQSYQVDCYACDDPAIEVPMAALSGVLRSNPRAPAASFDCLRASAPVEIAICSDARLARLDRQVAETYFQHIGWSKEGSTATKLDAIRAEQRAWLKTRDGACRTKTGQAKIACLVALYGARLERLENPTL